MITFLFIALSLAAIYSRSTSSIAFVIFALSHDILFSSVSAVDYWQYYLSCAVFAITCLGVLSVFGKVGNINTGLIAICICSFLVNAYGCYSWFTCQSITSYNTLTLILYLVAIALMLSRGKTPDELYRSYIVIHSIDREGFVFYNPLSKEIKS